MGKNRIGILGGSFDPIHYGHIAMAKAVLDMGYVDKVLVVPCADHPGKRSVASAVERWQMVCIACACDQRLEPLKVELDRPGPSYMADTLDILHRENPGAELFLIVGTDTLLTMEHWERLQEVLKLCTLLVCPRAVEVKPSAINLIRKRLKAAGAGMTTVAMEPVGISSTQLRKTLCQGTTSRMLPVSVKEYCILKGLYGTSPRLGDVSRWLDQLFQTLNYHRFSHTLGVAYTARQLAIRHGIDPVKAEQAGLLHDCAKCMPLKEMQQIAKTYSLTTDPEQLSSGALLHSLTGAWIACNRYGMADPEVLNAVSYHNTGHPGMTRLEMVVYLADAIEPGRNSYPVLDRVRLLSQLSLERALLMEMEATAEYVLSSGKHLHSLTVSTIEWLKKRPEIN